MSVILEFTVDSGQFRLGRVLAGPPLMRIELERIVPTGDAVLPFLWVTGDDYEAFEEKVRTSSEVEELLAIDRVGDSTLYRITWTSDHNGLVRGITESEGTVLEAHADGGWEYRIRFNDHDRLSQFHNYCTDRDIAIHIVRTYTLTERTDSVRQFDLSNQQREALVLGLRAGYFDTPREATLSELADELGISQQAVSNRIRRGTKHVLSDVLLSSSSDFG